MPADLTGAGTDLSCDLPEKQDTAYEAALSAAADGLIRHLKAEKAELDALKISAFFTAQFWHPMGDRAWIIRYYAPESTSLQPELVYTAFVISPGGEAITLLGPDETQDYWSILDGE